MVYLDLHYFYLKNLNFKTSLILGDEIDGDPAIDRLIEIRTVLEKIRPIDQKLRYQIDKLVKTAVEGVKNPTDAMSCRANPENFGDEDDDEEDEDDSAEDDDSQDSDEDDDEDNEQEESAPSSKKKGASKGKTGIYVPPKLRPVHYDGDETQADKEKKMIDRAKKRAMT